MRKVFLSVSLLQEFKDTKYVSDDYENVAEKAFKFPITYVIDAEVEENDEVEIITVVERAKNAQVNTAVDNYEKYMREVKELLESRTDKVNFTEITTTKNFDSLTFNKFFKKVAFLLKEEDKVYADMTFGMKPYSLSMFIALAYADRTAENVSVEQIIYAQKFTGTEDTKKTNISKIYDLTTLLYLNSMASNAKPGQKQQLDQLLNLMISD